MFDRTYEVILADTEATRTIHHKIRYHVYCLERGFENPDAFSRGEERDPWDHYAAPFIVRHRVSGKWVAAMRIILPHAASFPLEALQCLDSSTPQRLRRRQLGEVSRVCVIHSSHPNVINPYLPEGDFGSVSKTGESEVLLGLIRALILYGLDRGIEHYYLLVTGAFARLLRRLGVVLHQAGIAIEHRGWRTPYLMGLRESAASMSAKSEVMRCLFARKALAYRPFSAPADAREAMAALMPPRLFPLPAAEISGRMGIGPSGLGPDTWLIETARSQPGPGVWRGAALG
jgi:N-acyl amino acid synthase of PEP-CTERM/exosortase system